MAKAFTFDEIAGGGAAPAAAAPPKDFLISLIEFMDRAITLASEMSKLITTAKTELVPLITKKVQAQIGPAEKSQASPIPLDPEGIYTQTLEGLERLMKMLGDLPLSQVIDKMKKNKTMVLAAIKVKLAEAQMDEPGK